MKRSVAREIAVQLGFIASSRGQSVTETAELFFDEEYYSTLAEVDELFAEYPDNRQMDYILRLAGLMDEYSVQLNAYIEKYSQGWKTSRISKTAMAVLRCAVCEIMYMDDVPNSVAVNEAVELSKGYDGPDTVAFVNGVLGGIIRGELAGE